MRRFSAVLAALFFSGCRVGFGGRRAPAPPAPILEITELERALMESRTLSNLAALEAALGQFIAKEGKAPAKLEELIPKYISELPPLELGFLGHKTGKGSLRYPPELIQNEILEGSRLEDSGLWGYAGSGLKGKVFVDCSHSTSRGILWYREKGMF